MSFLAILAAAAAQAPTVPPPIIDMHMHAMAVAEFGNEPPEACIAAEGVEMHGVDPGKSSISPRRRPASEWSRHPQAMPH